MRYHINTAEQFQLFWKARVIHCQKKLFKKYTQYCTMTSKTVGRVQSSLQKRLRKFSLIYETENLIFRMRSFHFTCTCCRYLLYTHNWPLEPFSENNGLASHNTQLMLCAIILFVNGGTYNLTSTLKDRFVWETFSWQSYLLLDFLPDISWEDIAEEVFSHFWSDAWPGILNRTLRLISQHTTY